MAVKFKLFKRKRTPEDRLNHALDTLTTAHHVLNEQEAENVKKAIQELPEEKNN